MHPQSRLAQHPFENVASCRLRCVLPAAPEALGIDPGRFVGVGLQYLQGLGRRVALAVPRKPIPFRYARRSFGQS